ncbi:hypothetical protein HY031_00660 [Candidatus Gottesmanbacteria bacterium]|nr:hypothetical protein [Candidatus Gottesmanbacteria bacterium]
MGKEKNRSLGENKAERAFAEAAIKAGLEIRRSPSIRCDPPVEDKNGDPKKTVTTPDFQVFDRELEKSMFVEVTQGDGKLSSKAAQLRVAIQADIENYIQLTGDQIAALSLASTSEKKRELLRTFFGWDDKDK